MNQDSLGENERKMATWERFKNVFHKNPNATQETQNTISRRDFLKKSAEVGIGVTGLATVGAGIDHLASTKLAKAEGTTISEHPLSPHNYCYEGPTRVVEGGWAIPVEMGAQAAGYTARAQEVGIDTGDLNHDFIVTCYTEANQLLREENEWNIPGGLTIYVGVYQDTMVYIDQGQKFEALASTRRNWEDAEPKREAHILLSVHAYTWPAHIRRSILKHEVGHALKVLYNLENGGLSEHNPDENSAMFWYFNGEDKPLTDLDKSVVRYDYVTGKEKIELNPSPKPTPETQPPRPEAMPFKATTPGLIKE